MRQARDIRATPAPIDPGAVGASTAREDHRKLCLHKRRPGFFHGRDPGDCTSPSHRMAWHRT